MELTLKLNEQELAVLSQALGQMPYNSVAALIAKLSQQVQEQTKPKEANSE